SVIEPDVLMEMSGLSADQIEEIVEQAEVRAHDAEEAAAEERRLRRDRDRDRQHQDQVPVAAPAVEAQVAEDAGDSSPEAELDADAAELDETAGLDETAEFDETAELEDAAVSPEAEAADSQQSQ